MGACIDFRHPPRDLATSRSFKPMKKSKKRGFPRAIRANNHSKPGLADLKIDRTDQAFAASANARAGNAQRQDRFYHVLARSVRDTK
jgi:uncharacterized protein involved in copper resistance